MTSFVWLSQLLSNCYLEKKESHKIGAKLPLPFSVWHTPFTSIQQNSCPEAPALYLCISIPAYILIYSWKDLQLFLSSVGVRIIVASSWDFLYMRGGGGLIWKHSHSSHGHIRSRRIEPGQVALSKTPMESRVEEHIALFIPELLALCKWHTISFYKENANDGRKNAHAENVKQSWSFYKKRKFV